MNTALKATGKTSKFEKIHPVYLTNKKNLEVIKSLCRHSTDKLFQMLITRSVKNEERAV